MDLVELEKQVTLQEDIQEIEHLQRLYGYYFDNGMFQEVMDLFSENVESVEITDHGVFKGRDSVMRMYSGMVGMKRPGWWSREWEDGNTLLYGRLCSLSNDSW